VQISTLSETQYNYAASWWQGNRRKAREWAQRILNKKASLPRYLQTQRRPGSQGATLPKQVLASAPAATA